MISRFSRPGIFVLILLAAACVLWALSAPVPRDRLFAAVPPDAVFVSIHEDLYHRLPELLENPIIRVAWKLALESHSTSNASGSAAGTLNLLRRLAGKMTIVSILPREANDQHPVLLVSACGGWSQRLRWLASLGELPVTLVERHYGTPIWRLNDSRLSRPLYFSTLEGMVIACLAGSPDPLKKAIGRCYHIYPRLRDLTDRYAVRSSVLKEQPDSAAGRGWLFIPIYPSCVVPWTITCLSPERTSIRFYLPAVEHTRSDRLISALPQDDPPAPDTCIAVVQLTPDILGRFALFLPRPAAHVVRSLAVLADELGSSDLSFLFLPPQSEGSYLDLLAPVLPVLDYSLRPDANPEPALARLMDRINRDTAWNLVLRPLPGRGGGQMFAVESGMEGSPFDEIPPGLRPRVLVTRNHLFLAPATVDMQSLEGLAPALTSRLSGASGSTGVKLASAVVDLRRLAPLVQRAASWYVLKNLVAPKPDKYSQDPQNFLRFVQLSTHIMEQTGVIRAYAYPAASHTILELEAGPCSEN